MAVTNNITLFSDTATEYFNATELAEPTNTTHTGAVLNNRLNYKSYNSFAKTVSTICAGLAEFLATYGGIASGTMDVDTDLSTWTNYMQALTTDNKMANAQNAVTPLAISGTTTNTKSTTGHTHSLTMGTIESGNQNPVTGNTVFGYAVSLATNQNISGAKSFTYAVTDLNNIPQADNSSGIYWVSSGAANAPDIDNSPATLIYEKESSRYQAQLVITHAVEGRIWIRTKTSSSGWNAWTPLAIQNSSGGFACGANSKATNGFAGGNNAVANATNAVQLGTGTNNTANTMQFLDKQVLATNFSKLSPSTANGWTEANQNTTLDVEDGLYLIKLYTSAGVADAEIVEIISNTFSHLFSESTHVSLMSFFKFSRSLGFYNLIKANSDIAGSNFKAVKISEFTYYYKKLV